MGHGFPKIMKGVGAWRGLATGVLGAGVPTWLLTVMGLFAAVAEFGGGILVAIGFLFRPALLMMLFTMAGAVTFHIRAGQTDFVSLSHAIEAGIAFFALMIMGPGRYSLDMLIWGRREE